MSPATQPGDPQPGEAQPGDPQPGEAQPGGPIVARCLHCNERSEHPAAEAGRKIECPACGAPRRIPDPQRAHARAEATRELASSEEVRRVERRFLLGALLLGASLLASALALQLASADSAPLLASARRVRLALGAVGGAFLGCGLGFGLTRRLFFAYLAALGLALLAFSPVLLIPIVAVKQGGLSLPGTLGLLVLPLVALVPLNDVSTLARQRGE